MCRLIDALREEVGDARFAEGKAEEREYAIQQAVKMMRKLNASADQIAQEISSSYDLPMDVTIQKVEKYWANA